MAAQAIKKIADLGWNPVQILDINASPVGAVLKPAGLEASKDIISTNYGKDPGDPQWKDDPGMKAYFAFMDKYYPGRRQDSNLNTYGYSTAELMVHVLSQCGDDLTRENMMQQATNLKNFERHLALPGMKANTTADRLPRQQADADDEVQRRALGIVRPDSRGYRPGGLEPSSVPIKSERTKHGSPTKPGHIGQAARTVARNLPTSSLRRLLSLDSDWAAESTCEEADPVSLAPRCTSMMLERDLLRALAACCTLREISCVAAPCSSTAAAIVEDISDSFSMVPAISLMAPTDLLRRRLDAGDLLADLAGRFRGLLGQRLHLGSHDREAAAGFAGARRLDGGVQRQQIGLPGDGVDQFDDVADPGRRLRQFADAIVGLAGLIDRLVGHPRRFLHLAADLVDRRSQLLGGRGHRLHVGGGFFGCRRDHGRDIPATFARVAVSVPAEASSSVEADDTVSTISPTAPSNWSASLIMSALRCCAAA